MQLVSNDEQRQIEAFLYLEARLADESRYEAWEALVDDDMYYWVPAGDSDQEGGLRVSVTADNRQRLATRIAQLKTGMRHSQLPVSPMRRVVSIGWVPILCSMSSVRSLRTRWKSGPEGWSTVCGSAPTVSLRCSSRRSCWCTDLSRYPLWALLSKRIRSWVNPGPYRSW